MGRLFLTSFSYFIINAMSQDVFAVRSLHFHPTGDFLLAGSDDSPIRIYDCATLQGYINPIPSTNHTAAVNMVYYVIGFLITV